MYCLFIISWRYISYCFFPIGHCPRTWYKVSTIKFVPVHHFCPQWYNELGSTVNSSKWGFSTYHYTIVLFYIVLFISVLLFFIFYYFIFCIFKAFRSIHFLVYYRTFIERTVHLFLFVHRCRLSRPQAETAFARETSRGLL